MPSSKIPLPVKKTYSDACLYSVPKQSPLDRMRNDFERRRAEEKQRIRAVSLAQVDQRKRRLLNNGDSRLINNNFVGYTDFFNEPVIQCKGSFVTDVDHAQKPRPFTESAHPTGQLFRPEKRSAGRDRSHPLAAIDSQLLDNKRVTDVKLREEEASHTKQGKLLNNTYTVKKPPVGNQSLPYLVQPNRVHELSTLAELPPVRHRRLRSADNNYSVLPIKQKGHDSDENSDLPYGCMENVTENRSTCTNSRASSAKKTNEHSSHKHIREPEGNREYAEHQTSARITSSPTAHSAPVYSRGNTPVSCAAVNNKNGSNRTADSPTSVEHLLIVPVPPAGSRPSLDNGSYNAHLRRRQVMKQTILKQQRMKMLNGRITDTDDWQGVTAEINSECTALEENRVHHVQQDSDIQEVRQLKWQHTQFLFADSAHNSSKISVFIF